MSVKITTEGIDELRDELLKNASNYNNAKESSDAYEEETGEHGNFYYL